MYLVSHCFRKCKLFKHRKVYANLNYWTSKIFFGKVHYGNLLVRGHVQNFTISTDLPTRMNQK